MANRTMEKMEHDDTGLTRGLVAAGLAGHPDALAIVRRYTKGPFE